MLSSSEQHANIASFIDTQYYGFAFSLMSSLKLPYTLAKYVFYTINLLLASWNSYANYLFLENNNKPDVNLSNLCNTKRSFKLCSKCNIAVKQL